VKRIRRSRKWWRGIVLQKERKLSEVHTKIEGHHRKLHSNKWYECCTSPLCWGISRLEVYYSLWMEEGDIKSTKERGQVSDWTTWQEKSAVTNVSWRSYNLRNEIYPSMSAYISRKLQCKQLWKFFLRNFCLLKYLDFYENLTLRKYGAIRYLCV